MSSTSHSPGKSESDDPVLVRKGPKGTADVNADRMMVFASFLAVMIALGGVAIWYRRRNPGPTGSRSRAAIVLLIVTIALGASMAWFGRFFGASSPFFAGTVTLVTLGWTSFVSDLVPARLPDYLKAVQPWELCGGPYHRCIARFGLFIRTSPVRHLNPAVYLRAAGARPEHVRAQLETAEAIHFRAVLFTVPYLALTCIAGWWTAAAAILLVNLLANLYPICHLRLARGRLERCMKRWAE